MTPKGATPTHPPKESAALRRGRFCVSATRRGGNRARGSAQREGGTVSGVASKDYDVQICTCQVASLALCLFDAPNDLRNGAVRLRILALCAPPLFHHVLGILKRGAKEQVGRVTTRRVIALV